MRKFLFVLAAIIVTGLMATNASAAAFFTDDFTGGASANWANPTVADYTNDDAAFNGSGDSARNYIYTVDEDYASTDFIATADLTNAASGEIFFGLGEGVPLSWKYYEPKKMDYMYLRYNKPGTSNIANVRYGHYGDSGDVDIAITDVPAATEPTTIRVQFSWVAATSTATFSLDTDANGVYDYSYPATYETLSDTGLITRLFVGGAGGVTVDNFSVAAGAASVPEPSSLSLLVIGLLGLAGFTRKKKK